MNGLVSQEEKGVNFDFAPVASVRTGGLTVAVVPCLRQQIPPAARTEHEVVPVGRTACKACNESASPFTPLYLLDYTASAMNRNECKECTNGSRWQRLSLRADRAGAFNLA